MNVLLLILASTVLVSLLSIVGIFFLALREQLLSRLLLFLVALSAGALMGGAFLHLLPEAAETFSDSSYFLFVLFGFGLFFFLEKVLHWRHCHKGKCEVHSFAYLNLVGDGIHNFIDGLIIATSYLAGAQLGIVTTVAIASHEIPQEIGDFGVLVYGGFSRMRALFWNLVSALTAVAGGLLGYALSELSSPLVVDLIPIAAGGFLYIAAADLIPEIKKEPHLVKSMASFGVFVLGILLIFVLGLVLHD